MLVKVVNGKGWKRGDKDSNSSRGIRSAPI